MEEVGVKPIAPQVAAAPTPSVTPEFSQPAAAPIVMPTPTYSAPTTTMPNQPMGGSSNSTLDFFKDINWIEVGFMFLGAVGLYYTIYYYKYKLKEDRTAHNDIQRQIDKLNSDFIQYKADAEQAAAQAATQFNTSF